MYSSSASEIDDRRINPAQIQQRVQIFRGAPGDDRQDMQIRAIIDDAGHLGRETQGRTFEQAAGEADGPGVHLFLFDLWWGAADD